jgi:anti-sigma factor RsiW
MRCRTAQRHISRSVDGELPAGRAGRLERHLDKCADCRALAADLRAIAGAAPRIDAPEPSDKVWKSIRAELARADMKPSRAAVDPERRPLFGPGVPALRYAGVAALALVLVASGVFIGLRLGRQGGPAAPAGGEMTTLAKLDEAERHYQQAIRALSEAFASEKGALAPQVVELFDRNLAVIDATIQACRAAVAEEPDDLRARNYLLAAYMNKVTLLDSALDLRTRDREPAGKGKIL